MKKKRRPWIEIEFDAKRMVRKDWFDTACEVMVVVIGLGFIAGTAGVGVMAVLTWIAITIRGGC